MQILQVHHRFPYLSEDGEITGIEGGQERHVYEVSRRLVKRGHEVTVITSNFSSGSNRVDRDEEWIDGIHVTREPGYLVELPPSGVVIPNFLKRLIDIECDLIHAHSTFTQPTELAALASRLKRVPFVYTPHSLFYWGFHTDTERRLRRIYESTFLQVLFNLATAIVAVSPMEKETLSDEYGVDPNKIHVIGCGIAPNQLHKEADFTQTLKKYGIPIDQHYILFLGLLDQRKGPLYATKAFKIVHEKHPDTHLVLVGRKRDQYQETVKFINENSLQDHITIVGFVTDPERNSFLKHATVNVLPSSYEAFGMSLAESLYLGTPVVASLSGGVSYVVRHGVDGFLFRAPERENSELIAQYICQILEDPDLALKMGNNGRERVKQLFTWEAVLDQIESLYSSVLK
ncbi:MAG: glycosyltransferase family 4 protein [Candidatus Heimdallarchaeota archaeon]